MEATYLTLSQGLFLKLTALSFFCAFFSLHTQVLGLFGSQGIISIQTQINSLTKKITHKKIYYIPSLLLYSASDHALRRYTFIGMVLSIIAFVGFIPSLCFVGLFIIYLSFVTLGAPFLNFQWDALLLEVGFAAFWVSLMTPPGLLLMVWLWVLLFRFILSSGLVKWMSGCPEWRSLNALKYHFETQPLPNLGGYFAHHFLIYPPLRMRIGIYLRIIATFFISRKQRNAYVGWFVFNIITILNHHYG